MIDIKLKAYKIISNAVEIGISAGLNRAKKHTDEPTEDHIIESVHSYVMLELDEIIDFGSND